MSDDELSLEHYVAALVISSEPVAGKDSLWDLSCDVGGGAPVRLATNAKNVEAGSLVVVAKVGARLKNDELVGKATVGGVPSEGMLCDSVMLGWKGGAAGLAALLPAGIAAPGDAPPRSRPRGGGAAAAPAAPVAAKAAEMMFKPKLTKEEKKAAAAKRKAERAAAKAAAGAGGGGD